jgi:predicted RNA binding protein YcfA (HicA-like mRNA interferase family)
MSPKIPRDVSAKKLIKVLSKYGYDVTRQAGSHIRMSVVTDNGVESITVPNHDPIKLGTLMSIINDAATQLNIDKEDLIDRLR